MREVFGLADSENLRRKLEIMTEENFWKECLQTASRKWNLTELTCVYNKENGGVYQANSVEFGPVILKVHRNRDSLSREFRALTEMQGEACCQVYAFDTVNGLLLEERILPGTVLKQESDWGRRAASFVQVFETIHNVPKNADSYHSYLDWVRDACQTVSDQENRELSEGMHHAVAIAEEMFGKYPERMLLHGDLHHENMLKNETGNYCIIDPKGVVGPSVFDIPRFVLNELDYPDDSLRKVHIDGVIETLSRLLKYPAADLYLLLFMEIMLENAWSFGDRGEVVDRDMRFAREIVER